MTGRWRRWGRGSRRRPPRRSVRVAPQLVLLEEPDELEAVPEAEGLPGRGEDGARERMVRSCVHGLFEQVPGLAFSRDERDRLLEALDEGGYRREDPVTTPGEVARRYEYVDGAGEIGFISSVTEPFCGDCSRARLSADGMLYTCLFANRGTDLRESLRDGADDEELSDILSQIWLQRADRYSELRRPEMAEAHILRKVEMYRIGG